MTTTPITIYSAMKSLADGLRHLADDAEEKNKIVLTLSYDLRTAHQHITVLESNLASLQQELSDAREAAADGESLRAQLTQAQDDLGHLRTEYRSIVEESEQLEELEEANATLHKDIAELSGKNNRLSEQVKKLEGDDATLRRNLKAALGAQADAEKAHRTATTAIEDLTREVSVLRDTNATFSARIIALEDELEYIPTADPAVTTGQVFDPTLLRALLRTAVKTFDDDPDKSVSTLNSALDLLDELEKK